MNEATVAKNLAKHLQELYPADLWGDDITVMNKAQTKEHGYTSGGATILWEGGPRNRFDDPWTYDCDMEMLQWVQERYGKGFWLEAVNHWMLAVYKR